MAQYKVLQDIEAEDKLLGPLSLRQFIYAAITLAMGFVAFKIFTSPVWFFGLILVPPIVFFGLLAAPLGGQQSSEIWLLAKIRFFLKPRKRIWDQSGQQDLVTITVPKKIDRHLTKGYSQDEVKSRLRTLASTLDTRGWAVKNAVQNPYALPGGSSDRLLDIASAAPTIYVDPSTDMLDPQSNERAKAMDQMIDRSTSTHREQVVQNMRNSASTPPAQGQAHPRPPVSTLTQRDEERLLEQIHHRQEQPDMSTSHLKTLQPLNHGGSNTSKKQGSNHVTPNHDPAILNLVENSDGLSVQTIAGQANRLKEQDSDEVVISLH